VRRIHFDTAGDEPVCKGVFFEDGYSGAWRSTTHLSKS